MSLKHVYLLLTVIGLNLSLSQVALGGDKLPASNRGLPTPRVETISQLSPDEIAIENQAREEALVSGSPAQSTGRYYEIDVPKPVVTDRLSDTEYSKIQKIVNVDKLTEDTAKTDKPKLTKKQLEQIKLAQQKARDEKKRQELANRRELAHKKQVKVSFTEVEARAKKARALHVIKIHKHPVLATTLPKRKSIGRRTPASTVVKHDDTRIVNAETRQAARAEKNLQQEIDPNW